MSGIALLLAMVAVSPGTTGDPADFAAERAMLDSLRQMPRWEQVRWLSQRGLPDPYLASAASVRAADSSALNCVGRWSYGPATFCVTEVIGVDTVVFLSRGSGVSIVRFRSSDSLSLELLADINCDRLTGRLILANGLLYVGSAGLEVYDVGDLRNPARLATFPFVAYDHAIQDTFLYVVNSESLRIYSIADPQAVRFLGGCRDSGYAMCVSGGYAYLGHSSGLYIVDVTNPASPHRIGSAVQDVISLDVRDTLCYLTTTSQGLKVYNVRDPVAPALVGSLGGLPATTLFLPPTCDTVLYTPVFHAISIADPHSPRIIGQIAAPGWDYWVTAVPALNYALVADYYEGLVAVDITNPALPAYAGQAFAADMATDVFLDDGRAYVASSKAGMRILDVTDPARPATLGGIDTLWNGVLCPSVAAKDSFAFMGLRRPWFRSVDVTDPTRPLLVGACTTSTEAQDMVVRDSFVYCAINYQFAVVNVARPREPQVVGTCNLPERSMELLLRDTVAFVANLTSLQVLSVANPASPRIVGQLAGYTYGIDILDTVLYAVAGQRALRAVSIANPAVPFVLDSITTGNYRHDLLLVGSVAYCAGWDVRAFDVADPHNMRAVSAPWTPPSFYVRRLVYCEPYVYAACTDGGLCILDTFHVGIAEDRATRIRRLAVTPSVTRGRVRLQCSAGAEARVVVLDVTGRGVVAARTEADGSAELDLTDVPDGVYVVRVESKEGCLSAKVVKTRR